MNSKIKLLMFLEQLDKLCTKSLLFIEIPLVFTDLWVWLVNIVALIFFDVEL